MAAAHSIDAYFMAAPIRSTSAELWDADAQRPRSLDDTSLPMRARVELFVLTLQRNVCKALEAFEPNDRFHVDRWHREEGGGGITCVIQDGQVFEKAGVGVSVVTGALSPALAAHMRARGKVLPESGVSHFFAAGISSVIHPRNPFVPSMHFNLRYFEVSSDGDMQPVAWFGGGSDLTPSYLVDDDARHFHQALEKACSLSDASYYERFKLWCDRYFYIEHRKETRGVGGIFFDDLDTPTLEAAFVFLRNVGAAIVPSFVPLVAQHFEQTYSDREREWQLLRRGRYVEFNLLYDRGTKFGLNTPGARFESILMSLPLHARWTYCHEPEPGSPEQRLVDVLKKPRNWI